MQLAREHGHVRPGAASESHRPPPNGEDDEGYDDATLCMLWDVSVSASTCSLLLDLGALDLVSHIAADARSIMLLPSVIRPNPSA